MTVVRGSLSSVGACSSGLSSALQRSHLARPLSARLSRRADLLASDPRWDCVIDLDSRPSRIAALPFGNTTRGAGLVISSQQIARFRVRMVPPTAEAHTTGAGRPPSDGFKLQRERNRAADSSLVRRTKIRARRRDRDSFDHLADARVLDLPVEPAGGRRHGRHGNAGRSLSPRGYRACSVTFLNATAPVCDCRPMYRGSAGVDGSARSGRVGSPANTSRVTCIPSSRTVYV